MPDNHPEQDLLQEYAFGCLDAGQAERVGAHIASCASCRTQAEDLEGLLGELSLALPGVDPPPELEQKLMRRIRAEAGLHAVRTSRTARTGHFRGRLIGALAAGVILVLGAGNVIQWQQTALARRGASIPGLSLIVLKGVDANADAYGTVVLDARDNGGVLAIRGLRRLDPSLIYELWLRRGSEERSAGTFSVSDDGYGNKLLDIPKDFRGFTSITVTVEPAAGSAAPTGAVVARGSP